MILKSAFYLSNEDLVKAISIYTNGNLEIEGVKITKIEICGENINFEVEKEVE